MLCGLHVPGEAKAWGKEQVGGLQTLPDLLLEEEEDEDGLSDLKAGIGLVHRRIVFALRTCHVYNMDNFGFFP